MKWNEITWCSRWSALTLFLIVLPILTFSIGRTYQEVISMNEIVVISTVSSQAIGNNIDVINPCADLLQQQSMNQCAQTEFEKTEKELDRIYSKVTESEQFKSDIDLKIAATQKSWIEYRKLECDAEGSQYEGGSLESFTVSNCMTVLTRERIVLLNAWLETLSI